MDNLNLPNSFETTVSAQLAEERRKRWHQQGEALLTAENLRSWINAAGLVPFTPIPQLPTPAPSLVEAVSGATSSAPTLPQTMEARALLGRLVAEGVAVPLNLLGSQSGPSGDMPDFVASTAVFSYIFTLRGDKLWKQPPSGFGALKVSNLAVATYEALSRRGPLSAYDLATELGKEVTETAVLRALNELWGHLRVLPLQQAERGHTLWELSISRFTKQIKAGANAGQPSALSALISLYLGQALMATVEEIEIFLSPLSARSRVRDVVHALLAARQLDTVVMEGRTMLHVAGEAPAFLSEEVTPKGSPSDATIDVVASEGTGESAQVEPGEGSSRISKFVPAPRKVGTGFLSKAKPTSFATKALSRPKAGRREERPKREQETRPEFEYRKGPAKEGRKDFRRGEGVSGARPEGRPANWEKRDGGKRPFAGERPGRESGGRRESSGQPREFSRKPRDFSGKSRDFSGKPREFSGKPREFSGKPREFSGKPREFSGKPREFSGKPREFSGKPREFSGKPREFDRRDEGGRPPFRKSSSFERTGEFQRKPRFDKTEKRGSRAEGAKFEDKAGRSGGRTAERGQHGGGEERPRYRRFDEPRGKKPARPGGERREGASADRGFGGRERSGSRPTFKGEFSSKEKRGRNRDGESKSKAGGPFAKFHGGNKPFGKKPPARKFKPRDGGPA